MATPLTCNLFEVFEDCYDSEQQPLFAFCMLFDRDFIYANFSQAINIINKCDWIYLGPVNFNNIHQRPVCKWQSRFWVLVPKGSLLAVIWRTLVNLYLAIDFHTGSKECAHKKITFNPMMRPRCDSVHFHVVKYVRK